MYLTIHLLMLNYKQCMLAVKISAPPTLSSVIIITYRVIRWSFMMKKRGLLLSLFPLSSHTLPLMINEHIPAPL